VEVKTRTETETARRTQDKLGLVLETGPTARAVLCVAPTQRQMAEIMRHCASQKMVCTMLDLGVQPEWQVNWEWRVTAKEESWVEVESDVELEGSGTGGWKQEISSTLMGIWELLREQNEYLKRISRAWMGAWSW